MKKRILFVITASETALNFRTNLILKLIENNYDVFVAADDLLEREAVQKIVGINNFFALGGNNRSINPFKMIRYAKNIRKTINKVNPDVVFTFQLKPNILGVVEAKKAGVKYIFSMIEGLGDVFVKKELKYRLINRYVKKAYKKSLAIVNKCFFLNDDDMAEFLSLGLIERTKMVKISGIGISLERYPHSSLVNFNTFVMIARLLKSKGVFEYCEAAKKVKEMFSNTLFYLVGSESELGERDLKEYINSNIIIYLGKRKDIKEILTKSAVFVLPSYREGLPMSTMEAMAIGRPIITTNVPGCKDTVINGFNGYLVNKGDANDLAEKMVMMLKSPNELTKMGINSRKIVEEKFDEKIINSQILQIIEKEIQ